MFAALLVAITAARAETEPTMSASIGGAWWNPGLLVTVKRGTKLDLWSQEGNVLIDDTYLKGEGQVFLTPSFARVGPRVSFSPVAVVELGVQAAASQYFGTFSSVIGFDDPTSATDPEILSDRADQGLRGTGSSLRYGADGTLQMKVGPIAAVGWGTMMRWHARAEAPGDYYYEPESELLIALNDTTLNFNGVGLFEFKSERRTVYVGSMTSWARAEVTGDERTKTGAVVMVELNEHWNYVVLSQIYTKTRNDRGTFPPYTGAQVEWKK